MRHFATESGKSKGRFYTPAEVSRSIAQILEISKAKTSPDTTVYDPIRGCVFRTLRRCFKSGNPFRYHPSDDYKLPYVRDTSSLDGHLSQSLQLDDRAFWPRPKWGPKGESKPQAGNVDRRLARRPIHDPALPECGVARNRYSCATEMPVRGS